MRLGLNPVTAFVVSALLAIASGGPADSAEIGLASWYGKNFRGQRTASGEIYDHNALTCAHRSASFDSKLRVTNLDNSKVVVCRVADRGPFVRSRVIDLSRAAAVAIGMIDAGVVTVKVESEIVSASHQFPRMASASRSF